MKKIIFIFLWALILVLLLKDMRPFLVHVNRAEGVTLVWLCCLYILKANIFSKIFRAEVVLYGLFALYALISGVFLATNTNLVLDKASTVLQLLSLIVATITIVYVSKEVKRNLYLLFFAPVLLLIILIYNGKLQMFFSASDLS